MKIAIIENDFVIQMHLEQLVTKLGFNVIGVAASFDDAIALLEQKKPNFVLLDICLDGCKNGIDLAQYLNSRNSSNIIYITGNCDKMTLDKIKSTMHLGIITKPFTNSSFNHQLVNLTQ